MYDSFKISKDAGKVGNEEQWKAEGAMGLVMKGQGVQAIYGPKADVLKSDIQDILDSGEVILKLFQVKWQQLKRY